MQVFTWPGKDVDMGEDFDDWRLVELQQRVELVQNFDRLCDKIVSAYVDICKNHRITEKEILIPKTIKVLEPVVRFFLFLSYRSCFSGCGFHTS